MLRTIPLMFLLAAGCGEQNAVPDQRAGVDVAAECSLSARALETPHQAAAWSIFGPEHVATMVAVAPFYDGEIAVLVTLSPEGERRMLRFTKNNVGKLVAFYCGDAEISKVHITAPIDEPFRLSFPGEGET